jgi:alginate O-acetyltransferase complex protein AlgI
LMLLTLVIRTFDVEGGAFFHIMMLACGGFVVHHFLPSRLRMPFFVAVSLAGIVLVMGRINAAEIVGFGLALIALAR